MNNIVPPEPTARPAAPAAPSWLSRWQPVRVAMAAAAAAAVLAALLALVLAELLAPLGVVAAPLAAALAMLVISVPLALLHMKLARQVELQRQQWVGIDVAPGSDTGTLLAGRAPFIALAEREWARSRRYGGGIAVLVVEIDRLRRIGESRGAAAAAALLQEMARHTALTLRGGDALAQFTEGQLVVFLAHADPTGALDAAERIRERLEQLEVAWQGQPLRATVSIGAATLGPTHPNVSALLDDAQLANLLARQAGGNCVRTPPVGAGRLQAPGWSVDDNQPAGPH